MRLQIRRYILRVWDEGLGYEEFENVLWARESQISRLNATEEKVNRIFGGG